MGANGALFGRVLYVFAPQGVHEPALFPEHAVMYWPAAHVPEQALAHTLGSLSLDKERISPEHISDLHGKFETNE